MSSRIHLNGSDWLIRDFYGEDWRWRGSPLPIPVHARCLAGGRELSMIRVETIHDKN
jgi:hypothetical protein